jgi:predicted kinase
MIAFVVVRGPALSGKTTVASALAQRMRGKVAYVSQDDLRSRWIVGHADDVGHETALIYRQLRLLSTSYIREGYHVVVDGDFALYRDGIVATHESDLRELLGLVSTIQNVRPLLVSLTAPLEVLLERASTSERWDMSAVAEMSRVFNSQALPSALVIDTSEFNPELAVDIILERLGVRA